MAKVAGSKQRPSEIPSGHHPLTSCDLTSSTCAYVVVWVGGLGWWFGGSGNFKFLNMFFEKRGPTSSCTRPVEILEFHVTPKNIEC